VRLNGVRLQTTERTSRINATSSATSVIDTAQKHTAQVRQVERGSTITSTVGDTDYSVKGSVSRAAYSATVSNQPAHRGSRSSKPVYGAYRSVANASYPLKCSAGGAKELTSTTKATSTVTDTSARLNVLVAVASEPVASSREADCKLAGASRRSNFNKGAKSNV
jgi:hypothetical protein